MDYKIPDKFGLWVEVDVSALRHNVQQVKSLIGSEVKLMAVVKADAYGHGAVETSRIILESGADALAVTRIEEAILLRRSGIQSNILVFDSIQPEWVTEAIELGLDLTVCEENLVKAISNACSSMSRSTAPKLHLKIDTGMGRIGVLPSEAAPLAQKIKDCGLELAGIYTHFHSAFQSDLKPTEEQLAIFLAAVRSIKQAGIDTGIVHAANSAAMLRLKESHLSMVRPGTILYGQYPSEHIPRVLDLRNTWTLKTRISFIKNVPAGYKIGYGSEFRTRRPSRIAVIPAGWADGLTLMPESLARRSFMKLGKAAIMGDTALFVNVKGHRAPVVGRIAMQMCSVDVTDVPNVEIGDEVIIPTRRITTSSLIPRVYVNQ
jgi:alanine racemase